MTTYAAALLLITTGWAAATAARPARPASPAQAAQPVS
jgi:hypothetical protein